MSGGIRMVKDFMHLPTQPVVRIAGVIWWDQLETSYPLEDQSHTIP